MPKVPRRLAGDGDRDGDGVGGGATASRGGHLQAILWTGEVEGRAALVRRRLAFTFK